MLVAVQRPDKTWVRYTYDALGRRLTKTFNEKTTHYVWDGNVLLHEWETTTGETHTSVNENDELVFEIPENLITWIFEEGTFVPQAKLQNSKSYSIITDHLGTPFEAYDEKGTKVWSCELDIYGKVRTLAGSKTFIPFRYQGQYEDEETNLYYNRFRYYSPDSGTYISQDPIGLAGGMPNMYSYVRDLNTFIDPFGLDELGTVGYSVYGLYDVIGVDDKGNDILAKEPFYIGITRQDIDERMDQHIATGRYRDNTGHKVLQEKFTIEKARGYEQFYIDKFDTKTATIGQDLSEKGLTSIERGNKINSFVMARGLDPNDKRGIAFKKEYDKIEKNCVE